MRGSLQVPDEHCLAKPLESASPIAFARPAVSSSMQGAHQTLSKIVFELVSSNLLKSERLIHDARKRANTAKSFALSDRIGLYLFGYRKEPDCRLFAHSWLC
jgi:hypothetical protein